VELTRLKDPDRVKAVVKNAGRNEWDTVERLVQRELFAAEEEQGRKAKEGELRKQGIHVLTNAELGKATRILHYGGPLQHIDAAQHRKGPCAAVVVLGAGHIEDYCTEPGNHPAPEGAAKEAAKEQARQKARARHAEAMDTVNRVRVAFMAEILPKISKPDAAELMATALVHGDPEWNFEAACQLVGVLPLEIDEETQRLLDHGQFDEVEKLRAWATDGNLLKAGLAGALSALDPACSYSGWLRDGARAFFEFLKRYGYEISKAEKAALAGKLR
jgi:hypothetical protein